MRRPPAKISSAASISGAALLLALALGGCGGSSGGATAGGSGSAGSIAKSAVKIPGGAVIPLTSSAIQNGELPARYTCDGANIAPPLKWGAVPSISGEVVLFALGVASSQSTPTSSSIEWAVAGLKPELHGIGAGELPSGAFLVAGSKGKRPYSICPPKGQTRHYRFVIYSMPPQVQVGKSIVGVKLLENLAEGPPEDRAPGKGELSVTYTRR
jgi:phosphatidylethanolamine-binding protein (PEBP) family uncharacterized protein